MIKMTFRGRGGQETLTAPKMIGNTCVGRDDLYPLAFPTFGPERRGTPVSAFIKIDMKKIKDRTQVQNPDYLVMLDEPLFDVSELQNPTDCTVFINSLKNFEEKNTIPVDATKTTLDILHKLIINTTMVATPFSKSDIIGKKNIVGSLRDNLSPSVVDKNAELFEGALKEMDENGEIGA